jgi:shikimate kinase
MEFIFLYGPPGVGKLSVANELSKITGYRVFHNHLTINPVRTLFDFDSEGFQKLLYRYRIDAIEMAAESRLEGIIFTTVYGGEVETQEQSNRFFKRVVHIIKRRGGRILPVRLYCTREELYKRIKSPERKKHKDKIRTVKRLAALLERYNFFEEIPFMDSLSIDNTKLSPRSVARLIVKHYELHES